MANINTIENANMTDTGGGFRTYTGSLRDGNYFLTNTDWECCVLILDEDPDDNWEENDDPEWQDRHTIRELTGEDALRFWLEMLDYLDWYEPYGHPEIRRERSVVKAELRAARRR